MSAGVETVYKRSKTTFFGGQDQQSFSEGLARLGRVSPLNQKPHRR